MLNSIGLLLAIIGTWTYPREYTGAFVLGNLLVAILMRNELFGRFLYLTVNTLFAKVSSPSSIINRRTQSRITVAPTLVSTRMHVRPSAPGRHTFWMRDIGIYVARVSRRLYIH